MPVDSEQLNQRLADAALIAGRIAHDFDNVLTGIMGFAELCRDRLEPGSDTNRFVSEIARAGDRGIEFTKQLHQFSRGHQTRPQPSSLASVVTAETKILPDRHRANPLTVQTSVPNDLPSLRMDSGLVGVILRHLLDNAVEAMTSSGMVAVEASVRDLNHAAEINYLGRVSPGRYVEVQIHDSGSGITPAVRERLFTEPLYTTKFRHRGLGLATVFRILYAHEGGIRLDDRAEPHSGTVARFLVPAADTY